MLASGLISETPHADAPREVLAGVQLIPLPLPLSPGVINVYLVRLAEGYLLIDCGMDTEPCFQALSRAMEAAGVQWQEIREILLTHIHPDHMGLAHRLLQLTGARLWLHERDAEFLGKLTQFERYQTWAEEVLRQAGVTADLIAQIRHVSDDIRKSFHRLEPDRLLRGGEKISSSVGELEVIWTPGHSPGHVCLYGRERRVLFSGDQMLEYISPNIGWHEDRDPLGEFLASLDALARLEIDLILPSHGVPFSGHRDWIRKTIEHHADRCAHILRLLDGEPKCAAELANQLWERSLTPFHYRFAVFEVLAHLEYLERQRKVAQQVSEGIQEWRLPCT
jgi:glyoxylase-like metal-dependent hydrolase (beta-lactamase superfamily II)